MTYKSTYLSKKSKVSLNLKSCIALVFAILAVSTLFDLWSVPTPFTPPFQDVTNLNSLERAKLLLKNHPLLDTHNDLPWSLRKKELFKGQVFELPSSFATDIQRMRSGGMGGQMWSAYVPCSKDLKKKSDSIRETLEQIDLIKRMVTVNNDLEYAVTANDIRTSFAAGKIASLIGIEGGHQIDDSLDVLRIYFELGVRYMTLTHGCNTNWADSATDTPINNGLSVFGKQVVSEMNRLGMMVDISHVTHKVMRDVIAITKAPLFASHSSAHALCPTERNMPDDVIAAMKDLDGVIMINFWPSLITCKHTATIKDVADHIMHVIKIAGAQHVGFGGDYDGLDEYTAGMEDVTSYPYLVAELIDRGVSDDDLIGIIGGNLIRVLEKTELVSKTISDQTDVTKTNYPKYDC
ncbi:dipeptidase 1 (renal) [Globomyces sp. JEL0801]|nr:dipeptidase 1 (renal) [Globomyces sp. JEL0801]